jgi:hypothetical protein
MLKHVLPPVALWAYRRRAASWRYEVENPDALTALLAGGTPLVGAFLHARTFALLHYFSEPGRGRWMLMCSQSRDGELMTQVEEGMGFRVARGSSGKGGARALVEMIKAQREDRGLNSCLAADGSRGPRGIAQFGTITLAQKTGSLLVPVAASTADCWVWEKSWDRTVIPRRGATVRIRIGDPMAVPAKPTAAEFETMRQNLERQLLELHSGLDARTGFPDRAPLQAASPPAAPAAGDNDGAMQGTPG